MRTGSPAAITDICKVLAGSRAALTDIHEVHACGHAAITDIHEVHAGSHATLTTQRSRIYAWFSQAATQQSRTYSMGMQAAARHSKTEQQPATRYVVGSIPAGGALEVWPWTPVLNTGWLINQLGDPQFNYSLDCNFSLKSHNAEH